MGGGREGLCDRPSPLLFSFVLQFFILYSVGAPGRYCRGICFLGFQGIREELEDGGEALPRGQLMALRAWGQKRECMGEITILLGTNGNI